MNVRISFTIDCDFDLTPEEVFPDGVPENWSLADVVAACRQSHNISRWMDDWNVEPGLRVMVDRPNPAWLGDDVLFGDPPPRRLVESEDVW
jgi:hypothetical protein